MKSDNGLKSMHIYLLTIIRMAVGWHFLYEGISKVIAGSWSSAAYLTGSRWIFAPLFQWMAGNAGVVAIIDFINMWGMILVGSDLFWACLPVWQVPQVAQ